MIPFVDGHLDLAINVLGLRRPITGPLAAVRAFEAGGRPTPTDESAKPNFGGLETSGGAGPFGTATVTLPALRAGGAVMVVSTLLAKVRPWRVRPNVIGAGGGDFLDEDMAHAAAIAQLDYYECLEDRGLVRIVRTRADLPAVGSALPDDAPLPLIVTFESADPVRDPDDLHRWHGLGVRTLMLAHFGLSRFAHGTPAEPGNEDPHDVDGPLTDLGRALLPVIDELGMPLDLTHLADTSLYEALEAFSGPVYASHCACRALNADWQRNLPDDVVRTIAQRGGVIGLPLHSPFLVPGYRRDTPRAACDLDHVVDHLDHLRDTAGTDTVVALGTDMDGGFGLEFTPTGIDSSADLPALAERMSRRGWGDDAIRRVFAENWLRFFAANLPAA